MLCLIKAWKCFGRKVDKYISQSQIPIAPKRRKSSAATHDDDDDAAARGRPRSNDGGGACAVVPDDRIRTTTAAGAMGVTSSSSPSPYPPQGGSASAFRHRLMPPPLPRRVAGIVPARSLSIEISKERDGKDDDRDESGDVAESGSRAEIPQYKV